MNQKSFMTEQERKNWLQTSPSDILLHGPSKRYIDRQLWFYPSTGIAASYTVQIKDVQDHFDVFRGADMIESAGQAGVIACSILLANKEKKEIPILHKEFTVAFLGLEKVVFHDFVSEGETLISCCQISQFKFRQITFSATVYKTNDLESIDNYFENLDEESYLAGEVPSSFQKVAELSNFIGRAIKRHKLKSN